MNYRGVITLLLTCYLVFVSYSHAEQAKKQKISIAVISDLNGSYGSVTYNKIIPKVISRIIEIKPDLVISTGDMVAGQRLKPLLKRTELEKMWVSFHDNVSNTLAESGIPFTVTAGNHDGSSAKKFKLERTVYQEQWLNRVPEVKFIDQSHYPFYYAFELKNILFVALDASVVGHLSEQQFAWLKNVLEEAKGKYRHRVTFSHLPVWPFAEDREKEIIGDPALEKLLKKHQVALYLSGHHHAFYPGYKEGITHVSQACLGSGLRNYIGTTQRSKQGYTLIDIDASNNIHISAYETSDLTKPVDFERLPEKIRSQYALLIREDLVDK